MTEAEFRRAFLALRDGGGAMTEALQAEMLRRTIEGEQPLPRPRSAAAMEALIRDQLWCFNAEQVEELLAGCRAGDAEAAGDLVLMAPNHVRGHVVRWVYRAKLPRQVLRAALASAWDHDHGHVWEAAGSFSTLLHWFRAAAFDPPDLPDPVTLWRGTTGIPFDIACDGVSWTTKPEVAAFFAVTYRHQGSSLVLRRTVSLRHVLHYSDERGEAEAVVFAPAYGAVVDGDPERWRAMAEAWSASRDEAS